MPSKQSASEAIADAKKAIAAKKTLAAPDPDAPPPLPDEAVTESSQSEQLKEKIDATADAIAFEIQNTGIRVLRVVKLPELDTTDVVLYAKEWGVGTGFRMIATVRRVVDKLVEKGVLRRDKKPVLDVATGEPVEVPWTDKLDGLLAVVEDSSEDVLGAVMASIYTTAECAKNDVIEEDFLDELGIGDFVTMLRAIWHVNMESGSLKNALGALQA